jgi:hypothetical protein
MTQPSPWKLVLYLWGATILLLVLLSPVKQLLGVKHFSGGELLWLLIAPWIVGSIYRWKTKQDIPEEVTERVANYFVTSILVLSLIVLAAYLQKNWSQRLSENVGFLGALLSIYFGVLWFFGRWAVSAGLGNYGRKKKTDP